MFVVKLVWLEVAVGLSAQHRVLWRQRAYSCCKGVARQRERATYVVLLHVPWIELDVVSGRSPNVSRGLLPL